MYFFKILICSIVSLGIIFILTKLMGRKQISQLSLFDYIVGITIGSIAAEMATAIEDKWIEPLLAMIIYGGVAFLISIISNKKMKFRNFVSGRPVTIIDNGNIYEENLCKSKLDINELLELCRTQGYFNIADIQTAIFEANGSLSILPKSTIRPCNPTDLSLSPEQEQIPLNVIIDGNLIMKNIIRLGIDEKWIERELHKQGFNNVKNIFLATCDNKLELSVYVKLGKVTAIDYFK